MMNNHCLGKLVAFEGVDGAGKSSMCNRSYAHFKSLQSVTKVKEPAAYLPSGELIYALLLGKHELKFSDMSQKERQRYYFINRMEHYRQTVLPALSEGVNVFSDRSLASIVLDVERPGDLEMLLEHEKNVFAMTSIPFLWPDLIIIYDVPFEVAVGRLKRKRQVLDFFEQAEKISRTRKAYQEFALKFPEICRVVNAEGTEDEVFAMTLKILSEQFAD